MRWLALILFAAVLSATCAEPEPKKYKSEIKSKAANASLTDDERKFLREVEAKFGIKSDVPVEDIKNDTRKTNGTNIEKAPFPSVIAIEIVNDTETTSKGKKRTIDANLGYGYRTNNGYTYTYFGKQPQENGKFMIYPYSQEDIPPPHASHNSGGKYTSTHVEIQPSKAYELVEEDPNSYQYSKPTAASNYQNIKGLVSPPPPYASNSHGETSSHQTHPSTLYTTYNGHDFSALSGQFPMVMSNYLVDPSQLLKNPQYQSAGLSQDYIQSHHGSQLDQRVVPVLVLRIPSSYLKKPTAELYSSSPHNYPVSHFLNSANLQEIVNNYFKKIGYSYAPPVMAYQNSVSEPAHTPDVSQPSHEPQEYANPYVQHPSYTQAAYSGVQYSGVQPVMAKYPSSHSQPQYYLQQSQQSYQQPEQQYEYTYQYVPQSEQTSQSYYGQPQYQSQSEEGTSHENGYSSAAAGVGTQLEYGSQVIQETSAPTVEYGAPDAQGTPRHAASAISHYETSDASSQEYGVPKEQTVYVTQKPKTMKIYVPTYSSQPPSSEYGVAKQTVPKETLAYYPTPSSPSVPHYSSTAAGQDYYYQKQVNDDSSQLVLTENYPSKDHTIATVLPLNYKREKTPKAPSVQTVSYVTPMPNLKYQMHYKIMVPQTILRNPATEKVSYVNSHSVPFSLNHEYNPEAEYTVPSHYIPPVGKQRAPSYPKNYHSHPKRNAKPENKPERHSSTYKKQKERNDNKKSS